MKQAVKQTVGWFLVFMILFSAGSFLNPSDKQQTVKDWSNPFSDVTEEMWSYDYIMELGRNGIIPAGETFAPGEPENRGDFILSLYNMENAVFSDKQEEREKNDQEPENEKPAFTDVEEKTELYDAVCWAYQWGISSGTSKSTFSPESVVTREQACTILTRFAQLEELKLLKKAEADQFVDSLSIDSYARTGVTACQMAGLVNGYDDNYFYPQNTIARQECAALLCRLMTSAEEGQTMTEAAQNGEDGESGGDAGISLVDLTAGVYDGLYDNYIDIPFEPLIPEAAEGPIEFFAKTAFIGDSVSVMLMNYCGATNALGDATFLCAGSMSPPNMMSGQILPEYPKGSGQKPPIQDSVAACGAEVLYIMLGMNDIAYLGPQGGADSLVELIDLILEKSPDLTVIIESMTPMADSSTSYSDNLNNGVINQYNEILKGICAERKWYYLNVCEVLKDENGFLRTEYCSDYGSMGMHFNFTGTEVWVNYLKTHIPAALL